jgi:hypothetical protein
MRILSYSVLRITSTICITTGPSICAVAECFRATYRSVAVYFCKISTSLRDRNLPSIFFHTTSLRYIQRFRVEHSGTGLCLLSIFLLLESGPCVARRAYRRAGYYQCYTSTYETASRCSLRCYDKSDGFQSLTAAGKKAYLSIRDRNGFW